EDMAAAAVLAWLIFLGYGVVFWINREDTPIIYRNRLAGLQGWRAAALRFLRPGRASACWNLWAMALVHALAFVSLLPSLNAVQPRWFRIAPGSVFVAAALPLAGLFMLATGD